MLSEWHQTPEYINENWTEELLALMFRSRRRKLQRAAEARGERPRVISAERMFEKMGYTPEIVN